MKRFLRLAATGVLSAGVVAVTPTLIGAWPVIQMKFAGQAEECSWTNVLSLPRVAAVMGKRIAENEQSLRPAETDEKLGIVRFTDGRRSFWIGKDGHVGGKHLLAVLLAEHDADAEAAGEGHVRKGDVVIDVGGHVGVFTSKALERGASKVVALEPDARNIECLKRNFAAEIAQGRVVIYPKGAWSTGGSLTFRESHDNSGMHSAVIGRDGHEFQVAVEQIDKIAAELGLTRVDFIKMDIEGAEREALKGAKDVLAKHQPRLMVDAYHRPDDMPQLRTLLGGYSYRVQGCRDCDEDPTRVVPRVTFWTPKARG